MSVLTEDPQKAEFERRLEARDLQFTPELEQRFEIETGPARSQILFRRGIIGIAAYVAWLGVDALLTPDVFMLALALRIGLVVPLAAAALAFIARHPPPLQREGAAALICVLGGVVTLIVISASASPYRADQLHSLLLLLLFIVVVLGLRFPIALAASALILLTAIVGFVVLGVPMPVAAADLMVLVSTSVLSLIAAESFERNMRTAYLFTRTQRQRFDKLEDLSRHDPLTGLGNRRALDDALATIAADPAPRDLAVIVADIDHFKSYNDALGHLAGDQCLKRVAGIIAAELRTPSDRAVRFGGEEFLILLRDTDLWTATAIAERIRLAVESAAIPNPGRPFNAVVTVSLGLAGARLGNGTSPEELIRSADAALYAAKNAGRNQVWPRLKRQPLTNFASRMLKDSA